MRTIEQHLHHLRQKPEHIKKHVAFWTSFGITAIIFAFWLTSLSFGRSAPSITSTESPWHAVTASVHDAWSTLSNSFGGSSSANYNIPPLQVSAGK
ncbi:MAG: hypothetical protein KGJ35_00625 [Patescibacteria group bacterium]|nr:hypothetical protein [Patescibacteria group bacterium]